MPRRRTAGRSDQGLLKAATDACSTATGITLILFAGLIVSFIGMVTRLEVYPGAIAATRASQRQHDQATQSRERSSRLIGQRVSGRLRARYDAIPPCLEQRKQLLQDFGTGSPLHPAAQSADRPAVAPAAFAVSFGRIYSCIWNAPSFDLGAVGRDAAVRITALEWLERENTLDNERRPALKALLDNQPWMTRLETSPAAAIAELSVEKQPIWLIETLETYLEGALGMQGEKRQRAQRAYAQKRVRAEAMTFKLLGLDFSVGGYWAWIVWLFFFTLGLLQLWLIRRRLIRQCRKASPSSADFHALIAGSGLEGLPLWVRPLRGPEPWQRGVTPLANDAAANPLGALVAGLAIVCFVLAIGVVVPMALISNDLLSAVGAISAQRAWHAATLCLLTATIVALAVTWFTLPADPADGRGVEVVGRRAWLVGFVATVGTAALWASDSSASALSEWFLSPRARKPRLPVRVPGPRIRRAHFRAPELTAGFYVDAKRVIHFVPVSRDENGVVKTTGRAKSLGGRQAHELTPWTPPTPIDPKDLDRMHPSAVVPFVHAAVRSMLRGLTHRSGGQWRTKDGAPEPKPEARAKANAEKARVNALPETQARFAAAFALVERAALMMDEHRRKPNRELLVLLHTMAANVQSATLARRADDVHVRLWNAFRQRALEQSGRRPVQIINESIARTTESGQTGANPARAAHSRHARRKRVAWVRRLRYLRRASQPIIAVNGAVMTPRATIPGQAELGVIERALQKATAGEDFSAELARLPGMADLSVPPPSLNRRTDRSTADRSGARANATHVARKRRRRHGA